MPISYQIDEALGLVLTTATGVLSDTDILQHKTRVLEDPKWKPGMRELADARSIDRFEVTTAGVRRMTALDEHNAAALGSYGLAIVVAHDAAYGMARMYQVLTEHTIPNVRVFRDIDEAKRWIAAR
jgi:hypothetical protein